MTEITITWQTLLIIFGCVSTIGGGITYIFKLFKPYSDLKKTVALQEHDIKKNRETIEEYKNAVKVQNKVLLALVDHNITGNSIEKLKQAKNDLQDYLIEK